MIDYRLAVPADYSAIVSIAQENLPDNVHSEERATGALTERFSQRTFAAIAADLGIIVVYDADELAGFLCATHLEFDPHPLAAKEMLKHLDRVTFRDKPLASYEACMYGPVCIVDAHRGRGFLKGLFNAFRQYVAPRFEVGIGYVSERNPYALEVHVNGLDMADAGQFTFKGRNYHILACDVREGD